MKFVTEIRRKFVFIMFMLGFFVEGLNLRNRKYKQEMIVGNDIVKEMNNKEESVVQLHEDIKMKEAINNQNKTLNNLLNGSYAQDFQSNKVMNNSLNEKKEKTNETNYMNVKVERNDVKLESVIEGHNSSLKSELFLNNNQSKLSHNFTQEEQEIADIPTFQGENNLNNYTDITNNSETNLNSKITILNFTVDDQTRSTDEGNDINSNYSEVINHIRNNESNSKSILQNKANKTLANTTNNNIYKDHAKNTSKIPFEQKEETTINNETIHSSRGSDYQKDEIIYTNNQNELNKPNKKQLNSKNNITTINISNNNTL